MRSVILDVQINGNVSDEVASKIIGNIIEHVEQENKFWQTEGMIKDSESVSVILVGAEESRSEET